MHYALAKSVASLVRRAAALCVAACVALLPAAAHAESVFERTRALETEALGLLLEHFTFEESLLAPDNDRLTVFVSVPHGSRMVLDQVALYLNGKPVVTHRYTVGELQRFLGEATQQIYMTRIPQGEHTLRLEVKVMQGEVRPMQVYRLAKGKASRFVEFQIAGELAREIVVVEW